MFWLKPVSVREASHHLALMDNWPTIIFSLIHPVDEFSFKEMRTWGQYKISSCCICVWCESREIGGRKSPRFPTPKVESFSAGLLLCTKSYWAGFPLQLCMLFRLNPRA